MRDYLKVKYLSLVDEAKIIRRLERKKLRNAANARAKQHLNLPYHEEVYTGLHLHRVNEVRREARVTNIAYGFLRGHSYRDIENKSYTQPNWNRIKELVLKYTEGQKSFTEEVFNIWKLEALSANAELPNGGIPGSRKNTNVYQPRSVKENLV